MHHISKIWGCVLQFWFILILVMCDLTTALHCLWAICDAFFQYSLYTETTLAFFIDGLQNSMYFQRQMKIVAIPKSINFLLSFCGSSLKIVGFHTAFQTYAIRAMDTFYMFFASIFFLFVFVCLYAILLLVANYS